MSNERYTVKLSDGTLLEGLRRNGDSFMSEGELSPEVFRGKLRGVEISGPSEGIELGKLGRHEVMELEWMGHYTPSCQGVADGWYFELRDLTAGELEALRDRSDIDYIAMMTGVQL